MTFLTFHANSCLKSNESTNGMQIKIILKTECINFNCNIIIIVLYFTVCKESTVQYNYSQWLVNFAIGLVNSVLNLSNEQAKFLGGIQITEKL